LSYDAKQYGPDVAFDAPAFIHPSVQIYGKVRVGREASIWPNTVMRAENYEIVIGAATNIQDFVMVHVGDRSGTFVGENCSITHHVTLHGCRVGDNCLVGINATLMDGSEIGDNCIVGAGAVLTARTKIPDNSIVVGAPAKAIKTRNNYVANRWNAWLYQINAHAYREGNHRCWDGAEFVSQAKDKMKELMAEFDALKKSGAAIAREE
jgi:carbonic anhydrase/acetyltransferase-like protein (isoleucine patch superfamily)